MIYAKKAIQLAIEQGGYEAAEVVVVEAVLLDPKFWQTFGKVLELRFEREYAARGDFISFNKHNWIRLWHQFTDYLAYGGEIDSFFKPYFNEET